MKFCIKTTNYRDALISLVVLTLFGLILFSCEEKQKPREEISRTDVSQPKNIVDTALTSGNFNTFTTALRVAGLTDTLKNKGPYTVFAPTDQAFAKLPTGKLDELLRTENRQQLISLLNYHVVPGKISSAQLQTTRQAKTANGQPLTFAIKQNRVMVDNARVINADIECTNGLMHVVDTVIVPK